MFTSLVSTPSFRNRRRRLEQYGQPGRQYTVGTLRDTTSLTPTEPAVNPPTFPSLTPVSLS